MLIQLNVSKTIGGSVPLCDEVKGYIKAIKEQLVSSDNALANTLMHKLLVMEYHKSRNVHEHIMDMKDIATQLKSLEIKFQSRFLSISYSTLSL